MSGTRSLLLAAAVTVGAGCRNPCQQVCAEMADYAEECSLPVTDADLDACLDRHAEPAPEDGDTCREFGDPDVIRAQWSCEDLERYWGADG
jgi:hypothetical protein